MPYEKTAHANETNAERETALHDMVIDLIMDGYDRVDIDAIVESAFTAQDAAGE